MLNCLAVCGSLHPPFRLEIVAAAAPAQKTRSRWRNSAHTCKIPGEKMDDYSKSSGARGKKAAAVKAEEPMTDEDDESPRLPLSSLRLSPGPMAAGAESPLLTSTSLNDPVIADAVDRGNESFVVNNAGVFADTAIRVLGPGERIATRLQAIEEVAWAGSADIVTNGYGNLQYDAYEHPSAKPRPLRRVSGYSSSRSSSGRSLRDGYHEAGGLGIELSEKSNIYALDNGTTLGVDGDSNFEGRRDMINMRSPGFYLKKSGFNGSPSQRRKSKEHKHQSVFDLAEHGVDNEKLDLLVDKVVERLHPTIVWAMEKGDHNTESVLTHLDNVTAQTSTTAKLVSSRHSGPSGVTPRVEASFTLAVLRVNAANTLTYVRLRMSRPNHRKIAVLLCPKLVVFYTRLRPESLLGSCNDDICKSQSHQGLAVTMHHHADPRSRQSNRWLAWDGAHIQVSLPFKPKLRKARLELALPAPPHWAWAGRAGYVHRGSITALVRCQQQQAASQQTYPSPAQSTLDVQQVSELAGAALIATPTQVTLWFLVDIRSDGGVLGPGN
ncbi:hypothetical protein KCU62_g319, partial [Aureobasidium sp. EXF-3399]